MPLRVCVRGIRIGRVEVQGAAFYLRPLEVDIQKLKGMRVWRQLGPILGPSGGVGERQNQV